MKTETIYAILTVAVILVVIAAFVVLFKPLQLFGFGELNQETKQKFNDNFDVLLSNIDECKNSPDKDCVCDGFPNFPGTFKGKLIILTKVANTELSLQFGSDNYFAKEIENLFISGVLVNANVLDFDEVSQKIDLYNKKWIDFDRSIPVFDNEKLGKTLFFGRAEPKVVSSLLYKDSKGILYIFISDYPAEEVAPVINELKRCG